jgi:tetratricopeptide (TPR) repeat protein
VAEALNEVGTVYHMMGEYQTAIPFLKEALEMKQALQGVARERKAARRKEKEEEVGGEEVKDEHVGVGEGEEEEEEEDDEEEEAAEQILQTMYDLASTYAKNAEYTLAQPLYTDLITHRRNESPPNYIKLARALTNAGAMHMEAGDAELALPFYDEALDIFRMVFSEGHPEIAQAMGNLAEVYRRMEKNDEALQLFKMSLNMQRARGGGVGCCTKGSRCQHAPDPMGMAGILNNCAVLYRAMDDYPEAEKHMEEAICWVKKAVPAGHPYISSMENSLRVVKREGEEKRNGTYDPANYYEKSLHSGGGKA